VLVFTHAPPHETKPAAHGDATHMLSLHVCVLVHAAPHAPQLRVSTRGSTQLAPHMSSGAGQPPMHTPAMHDCPAPHLVPQVPQLVASVAVLTHAPPQRVRPPLHGAAHTPA
jgi:hypothetical protein